MAYASYLTQRNVEWIITKETVPTPIIAKRMLEYLRYRNRKVLSASRGR